MKNIKNIVVISFLSLILGVFPLQGSQGVQSAEIAVEQVDKKMSLLDRIIEQVNSIVDAPDQKDRDQAKRQLTKLMKHKDLDVKIKEAIKDDIEIIKNPKTKRELHAARIRLLNTYTKINSKANVVDAIAQATEMVQNASPEELDAVIVQAKQKVEEAEQEEQGFLTRMYTKAKRFVTAPVDYVFGKEASYAKTAFYATVGLAVLAAGGYGLYQYASINQGKIFAEKKDYDLEWFNEEIEKYSQSPENASVNERYDNEVSSKSRYQIRKYIHEREKELKQRPVTSGNDKKIVDDQMRALEEFKYFVFEEDLAPGQWRADILLRNPDNLSKNSHYLKKFTEIMISQKGHIDLTGGYFYNTKTIENERQEFLKALQQYSNYITENEKKLSEKVNIPSDKLYKEGLTDNQLKYIEELEQSMKEPTLWQRWVGKKKK